MDDPLCIIFFYVEKWTVLYSPIFWLSDDSNTKVTFLSLILCLSFSFSHFFLVFILEISFPILLYLSLFLSLYLFVSVFLALFSFKYLPVYLSVCLFSFLISLSLFPLVSLFKSLHWLLFPSFPCLTFSFNLSLSCLITFISLTFFLFCILFCLSLSRYFLLWSIACLHLYLPRWKGPSWWLFKNVECYFFPTWSNIELYQNREFSLSKDLLRDLILC